MLGQLTHLKSLWSHLLHLVLELHLPTFIVCVLRGLKPRLNPRPPKPAFAFYYILTLIFSLEAY